MPNALQVGQRQLPLQKVLQHLTTSPALFQYLRLSIIEETLVRWQQSPEYQTIYSEAELSELYHQISQITKLPHSDPGKVEAFKRSQTLQKYQQVQWGHRIPSYFLVRKRSLDRAIFSAIQIDNLGMAQELYLRVKDRRQSFDKLARLYSQGAEAKLGGVLGPIPVERIHPQIAYHLSSLKPGELSPLFQIDNFHIFVRLEQLLPAKFDADTKGRLMEELFEQWLQSEISNRISSLAVTELGMMAERRDAIDISEDRQPQLPSVREIDRSQPEIIDAQIVSEDTVPATPPLQPLTKIDAGISFFPPVVEEPAPPLTNTPDAAQSKLSERIDRSIPIEPEQATKTIPAPEPDLYHRFSQKMVAFCVFFALFLGGGLGVIYLLNTLVGPNGVRVEQQK
jgi:PPIC-type PPIASE domain